MLLSSQLASLLGTAAGFRILERMQESGGGNDNALVVRSVSTIVGDFLCCLASDKRKRERLERSARVRSHETVRWFDHVAWRIHLRRSSA